ncbi:thiol disulfide reductase thioredoxin [Malaciobacter pacificus]|jgi:thioredoxin 2|uniref:Thioredoxin n=1 Tax=Malaciobacter pacificus TaxID=1080223 RepID=A0A5C2H8M4_9BACT|nr:thioredoxin TrxC [Malaciobacter pacificus]QEP34568.1 thioredoxin [Malaciobacter pacificus]GGD33541.1 thiol disulfide reductase thioredoxin [Malaciobacter pacificus]
MSKLNIVCPHCKKVNSIPKKDSYSKANCGSCKNSLLDTTPIELDESNFDHVIVNSDIPVIVDFWAPWCGPCKMFAPIYNEVSQKYPLKALFTKVNTEAEQNLGAKFGIRSIPTLIIYKNGVEVKRVSGALDPLRLSNLINENL